MGASLQRNNAAPWALASGSGRKALILGPLCCRTKATYHLKSASDWLLGGLFCPVCGVTCGTIIPTFLVVVT